MIAALVRDKESAIRDLCRKHRVRTLDLFGSGAEEGAFTEASDLDFLVDFEPMTPEEHVDCYFGLVEDLEILMNRRVDLVEAKAVRNPYLKASIESTRRGLYAA